MRQFTAHLRFKQKEHHAVFNFNLGRIFLRESVVKKNRLKNKERIHLAQDQQNPYVWYIVRIPAPEQRRLANIHPTIKVVGISMRIWPGYGYGMIFSKVIVALMGANIGAGKDVLRRIVEVGDAHIDALGRELIPIYLDREVIDEKKSSSGRMSNDT
jgi:hypothetical protein